MAFGQIDYLPRVKRADSPKRYVGSDMMNDQLTRSGASKGCRYRGRGGFRSWLSVERMEKPRVECLRAREPGKCHVGSSLKTKQLRSKVEVGEDA